MLYLLQKACISWEKEQEACCTKRIHYGGKGRLTLYLASISLTSYITQTKLQQHGPFLYSYNRAGGGLLKIHNQHQGRSVFLCCYSFIYLFWTLEGGVSKKMSRRGTLLLQLEEHLKCESGAGPVYLHGRVH